MDFETVQRNRAKIVGGLMGSGIVLFAVSILVPETTIVGLLIYLSGVYAHFSIHFYDEFRTDSSITKPLQATVFTLCFTTLAGIGVFAVVIWLLNALV